MRRDGLRQLALDIAYTQIGKPYIWGGDDTMAGFDCSGFICEVLKSVGVLPKLGDWTAAGLEHLYPRITGGITSLQTGHLVFWVRNGKIGHVEMVFARVDEPPYLSILTIGASGGGSSTLTLENAIKQNAYIKIRPLATGWVSAVDPFDL